MLETAKKFYALAKPWATQATTGFGLAGGFGAATAVITGQARLSTMVPVLASSTYLILHPEQNKPALDLDTVKQMAATMQAGLEKVGD